MFSSYETSQEGIRILDGQWRQTSGRGFSERRGELEAGTYVLITTDNPINPLSVGTFLLAETEDGIVSYIQYGTIRYFE